MTSNEHPLSWQALGRVVLLGLGIFLAYQAIDVLASILVALILATAVFPLVTWFAKRMPLLLAAIIVFVLILVPFVLFGIFLMPAILNQGPELISTFHTLLSHATFLPPSFRSFDLSSYLSAHSGDLLVSAKSAAQGVIVAMTVFFMAFYFVLDSKRFLGFFLDLFPKNQQGKASGLIYEIGRVNGMYIRGNVLISLICAVYLYVVLMFLKVPFALPLAIFAGILDLLPLVGGTLGTVPALIIGYTISPLTGTLILIFHLIYQQLENAVISPAVYHRALDISPALSFLSVVIGGGLFGILGAFLALPVAASLPAVARYYQDYRTNRAHAA